MVDKNVRYLNRVVSIIANQTREADNGSAVHENEHFRILRTDESFPVPTDFELELLVEGPYFRQIPKSGFSDFHIQSFRSYMSLRAFSSLDNRRVCGYGGASITI